MVLTIWLRSLVLLSPLLNTPTLSGRRNHTDLLTLDGGPSARPLILSRPTISFGRLHPRRRKYKQETR